MCKVAGGGFGTVQRGSGVRRWGRCVGKRCNREGRARLILHAILLLPLLVPLLPCLTVLLLRRSDDFLLPPQLRFFILVAFVSRTVRRDGRMRLGQNSTRVMRCSTLRVQLVVATRVQCRRLLGVSSRPFHPVLFPRREFCVSGLARRAFRLFPPPLSLDRTPSDAVLLRRLPRDLVLLPVQLARFPTQLSAAFPLPLRRYIVQVEAVDGVEGAEGNGRRRGNGVMARGEGDERGRAAVHRGGPRWSLRRWCC